MLENSKQCGKLKLRLKKLNKNATIPTKGSAKAAGYDLYSSVDTVVKAKGKQLIETGLAVAIPPGNYGRVAPRSGLTWKHFIDVGAGVIDEDFRGERNNNIYNVPYNTLTVCVILFNFGDDDYHVKVGDRIAQLIIEKITEVEIADEELNKTERGMNGFGSTGYSEKTSSENTPKAFYNFHNNEESKDKIMNYAKENEDLN